MDREITDPLEVGSVLTRGRVATISMCQDGEPYLVTLSYGYDAERHALYSHVATVGRKLDAIAADPRVCGTVVIDLGYQHGECKHLYESVVFTGRMTVVADPEEARHGMTVLIGHLEDEPEDVWERQALDREETWRRLRIVRLDIDEITGKASR
jgi:nitroimidazol reductase NimA-like FMN-containing flavoprotein (pyridoxamine 5'-phosphate oxidase superfamily)